MNKWSVLIVDDEMPARQMLMNIIDWNQTDFKIVDTAINGKDALDKMEAVDVVITDIQMPVMDGLDLIREAKEKYPGIMMIVLSCHEDFIYAKEAMSYGVTDYLIKDLITPSELLNALNRSVSRRNRIHNQPSQNGLTKDLYKDLLRKHLLTPHLTDGEKNIPNILNKLALPNQHLIVMSIVLDIKLIDENGKRFTGMSSLVKKVSETLDDLAGQGNGFSCYDSKLRFVFIANMTNTHSKLMYFNESYILTEKIRDRLAGIGLESITIGISNKCPQGQKLPDYYLEALTCSKQRIFYGNNKNIFYDQLITSSLSRDSELLREKLSQIKKHMSENQTQESLKLLKQLYSKDIKGFMQYNYLKYVNHKLFDFIENYMMKYNKSSMELFGSEVIPYDYVDSMMTTDDMHSYFKHLIESVMINNDFSDQVGNPYCLKVNQAIDLLQKNYRQGIKLDDVANALSLHKVYLSRIFKEETGVTIGQYTQKLIVDDAIKLLTTTHMKVYEIAEILGYGEGQTDQLNTIFKRQTGLTPSKYRKKHYK